MLEIVLRGINLKKYKNQLVFILDLFMVSISYVVAVALRFDFSKILIKSYHSYSYVSILIVTLVYGLVYWFFKNYRSLWATVSIHEALNIALANVVALNILIIFRISNLLEGFPISILLVMFMITTLIQFSYRVLYRYYRIVRIRETRRRGGRRILIYGAGSAGRLILNEILENDKLNYFVVGFIDDNEDLSGSYIYGTPVMGTRLILDQAINDYEIDEIFVAMPSVPEEIKADVAKYVIQTGLPIKVVSSSKNLIESGLSGGVRKLDVRDLLGRPEIKLDTSKIKSSLMDKVVLVTGAGGSIGSELVRQIVSYKPKHVIMLDLSETGLYELQQELKISGQFDVCDIEVLIKSIRDKQELDLVFQSFKPDVVFHAAAHKHVPLMERVPEEAVKNNIFGTKNIVDLCLKYDVDKMVSISTDKAVNPTNVMGATKRFNEMMIQSHNKLGKTKFVAVRFGNVLGSNGSVVPLFQKQISSGGPVTVTHPEIIRYFMTIPEAVSLVLEAYAFAKGGEIFVLDMGEPVKILDLAEKMIELSGYRPYEEIDIVFVGLREGEKLFEELLMAEEGLTKTENNLIYIANPIDYDINEVNLSLKRLEEAVNSYDRDVKEVLKEVVPTYKAVS